MLATGRVPPWRVLVWAKFIEAVMQFRPRALQRLRAHPDPALRDAMKWYYRIGHKVWPYEIRKFLLHEQHLRDGPTLAEFWSLPHTAASPVKFQRSAKDQNRRCETTPYPASPTLDIVSHVGT